MRFFLSTFWWSTPRKRRAGLVRTSAGYGVGEVDFIAGTMILAIGGLCFVRLFEGASSPLGKVLLLGGTLLSLIVAVLFIMGMSYPWALPEKKNSYTPPQNFQSREQLVKALDEYLQEAGLNGFSSSLTAGSLVRELNSGLGIRDPKDAELQSRKQFKKNKQKALRNWLKEAQNAASDEAKLTA